MSRRTEFIISLLCLIGLLFVPFWIHSDYILRLLCFIGINIIVVLGFHFLLGLTGQLSIGHAAFYGIGAYTSALLTVDAQWSFWLALPAAVIVAAVFGFIVGTPAIRVRRQYLALVTLGFHEIFRLVMMNWTSFTHGAAGISKIPSPHFFNLELSSVNRYYYFVLIVTVIAFYAAARITNSAVGRSMKAVREHEIAARSVGVRSTKMKIMAFVLGAAYAGLGGSLYAHLVTYISPDSFTIMESVYMLISILIGGVGSVYGVLIGVLVITGLPELLRIMKQFSMLAFGGLIVTIIVFMPQGLVGLFHRFRRV